ncbi:MAG: N-acetyltransferase [Elusimicrobia bacterium]|nr:N-acetyltransferase [Elusimicrobiota bacterium]
MDVKHDRIKSRFYVETEDGDAFLMYSLSDGCMDLYETYVPNPQRGKGLAPMIVGKAVEHAKREKYSIRPTCPYIKVFLRKHPEFGDLVDRKG